VGKEVKEIVEDTKTYKTKLDEIIKKIRQIGEPIPINLEKFQLDLDQAVEEAGERTDIKLAGKISAITRLTDNEVRKLFSDPADVKKLAELMEIVKGAGETNQKVSETVKNAEELAWVVLTLLSKFS
jgi:hypothetical protein